MSYFCFFNTITEYYCAKDYITEYKYVKSWDFILKEPLQCGDILVKPQPGRVLFSFIFTMNLPYVNNNPLEKTLFFIDTFKAKFFGNEKIGTYFYSLSGVHQEKMTDLLDNLKSKSIIFEDMGEIDLIIYCYNHGLFDMKHLSEEMKSHVKDMLEIEELRHNYEN